MKRLSSEWQKKAWKNPRWKEVEDLHFKLSWSSSFRGFTTEEKGPEGILRDIDEAWAKFREAYETVLKENPPEYEEVPDEDK